MFTAHRSPIHLRSLLGPCLASKSKQQLMLPCYRVKAVGFPTSPRMLGRGSPGCLLSLPQLCIRGCRENPRLSYTQGRRARGRGGPVLLTHISCSRTAPLLSLEGPPSPLGRGAISLFSFRPSPPQFMGRRPVGPLPCSGLASSCRDRSAPGGASQPRSWRVREWE